MSNQPVTPPDQSPALRLNSHMAWTVLLGNFVIGCGMFVVPATLDDISRAYNEPAAATGQLISAAALVICVGTPILGILTSKMSRRKLLAFAMLWFAVLHALSTFAPNLSTLIVLRMLTVMSSAVFTPQAAAFVGQISRPAMRSQVISFVFSGWTFAAAFGIPLLAAVSGEWGWRWAFGLVAVISFLVAVLVWKVIPDDSPHVAISSASWSSVFVHKLLMLLLCVTFLTSFAQHVLYSYIVVYYKQVLDFDTSEVSLIFFWFGLCTLFGSLLITRYIARIGALRMHFVTMSLIALGLLLWPLAHNFWTAVLVCTPWALAFFANNAAQQGRLAGISPALAGASIALNTSAIYIGHALGAVIGGWWILHNSIGSLHWVGFGSAICAIALASQLTRLHKDTEN